MQSIIRGLVAAVAALWLGLAAAQQNYPTKSIRFIVTFPPGGSADLIARALAPILSDRLRQRGKEVWRDDRRRMLAEHRRVLPPGLGGSLVQLPAHGEKQLGRLARDLDQPVGHEPKREECQHASHELQPRRRCAQRAQRAARFARCCLGS